MSYTSHDKHGTYYFRKAIPPRLRAFIPEPWTGKVEWKRTLNTKKPAEAKVRAARALSDCTADFQAAERAKRGEPPITPSTTRFDSALLSELEAGALRSVLAADEAERSDGDDRRHLFTADERSQFPALEPVLFGRTGMMDDHLEALGDALPELAADFKNALKRNNPSIVSAELRMALRPLDLLGKLTPDDEHEAGLAVLKGTGRAYAMLMKRQEGEVVETPKPAANKGPKISEAFTAWKAGGSAKGARKPGDNTIREAEHAVRRFREWHGDMRLGDITREKA